MIPTGLVMFQTVIKVSESSHVFKLKLPHACESHLSHFNKECFRDNRILALIRLTVKQG